MRTLALPTLLLAAALAAAPAHAGADAGADPCVVRVDSPADGTSAVRSDILLVFAVSESCAEPLPTPTLRDPNGALIPLELTRDGAKLTGRPLGFLIDGLFEVDPGSRSDECASSKPARVTKFRMGPGPEVRAIVFSPQDRYTAGSELESLEIFLSEPLASGTEADIPRNVSVSGLEASDIFYLPDTASILWSWKTAASGIPPTTTEKVTIRVQRGLTFASGQAMATDFEVSLRPKDFLVHEWWPGATACAPPTNPDPGTSGGGEGITCGAGAAGSPLGLAAAFLLAPLLARLALRRRA